MDDIQPTRYTVTFTCETFQDAATVEMVAARAAAVMAELFIPVQSVKVVESRG